MSSVADWDAAQARLHGLRSGRPGSGDWLALEATLGWDEFLARARQAPFGRWLDSLSNEPTLHDIDRVLRAALRRDCARLANWYGEPWRKALLRLSAIVDLPLLAGLLRGDPAPATASDDPAWRPLIAAPATERFRLATGLLLPSDHRVDAGLFDAWIRAWLAALPACTPEIRAGFSELTRVVADYRRRSAIAAATPAMRMHARLALLFRRHAGTPVAMACEIAATALDLQRLRAGLLRRLLTKRATLVAA